MVSLTNIAENQTAIYRPRLKGSRVALTAVRQNCERMKGCGRIGNSAGAGADDDALCACVFSLVRFRQDGGALDKGNFGFVMLLDG